MTRISREISHPVPFPPEVTADRPHTGNSRRELYEIETKHNRRTQEGLRTLPERKREIRTAQHEVNSKPTHRPRHVYGRPVCTRTRGNNNKTTTTVAIVHTERFLNYSP